MEFLFRKNIARLIEQSNIDLKHRELIVNVIVQKFIGTYINDVICVIDFRDIYLLEFLQKF